MRHWHVRDPDFFAPIDSQGFILTRVAAILGGFGRRILAIFPLFLSDFASSGRLSAC
jgi:hypothetical protein